MSRPKLDEAGSGTSGSAPATTTTTETATPLPPQQPSQPTQTQQQPGSGTPEGYVPIDQLRAVTAERDRLNREREEADKKTAEEQGRWQELAQKHEAKAKDFESRFMATARRAAFVAGISSKASDPMAAYKLALADGLLNDVKVNDEGEADEEPIAKAIDATLKKYPMLKAGAGSFGGERGSTQSETPGFDPKTATATQKMIEGMRRGDARVTGSGQ
jgi:hypothetical protein